MSGKITDIERKISGRPSVIADLNNKSRAFRVEFGPTDLKSLREQCRDLSEEDQRVTSANPTGRRGGDPEKCRLALSSREGRLRTFIEGYIENGEFDRAMKLVSEYAVEGDFEYMIDCARDSLSREVDDLKYYKDELARSGGSYDEAYSRNWTDAGDSSPVDTGENLRALGGFLWRWRRVIFFIVIAALIYWVVKRYWPLLLVGAGFLVAVNWYYERWLWRRNMRRGMRRGFW
jgi:hypothetical protein